MRCLVLGAGGFLGGNLSAHLVASGHQVLAYDRHCNLEQLAERGFEFERIEGDFCTESRWTELLGGVQVCYHLISTTVPKSSNADPAADVLGNVVGTLNLLEAARKYNVRIVFASSGGTVYGAINSDAIDEEHPTNPLCSYGVTKLTIEKYLFLYRELHGVSSVVLRIANPYGEGQKPDSIQGAIGVFLGRILRGHTIDIWGDGSVIRDYIYVEDVVRAMVLASLYGGKSTVFNVGSGVGISLLEMLKMIEQVTGKTCEIIFHPPRGFDVPRNVLNISKARNELGWAPQVSILDGLERTAIWMRETLFNMQE